MSHSMRFGVCYDFRNPPDSDIATPSLYGEVLDQIQWLDQLGLDLVWFTEHHFVDDGYLPAWIPVASAAAARTKRVRFSCDICLLPFNNPVRLAEDLAVLDNLSNGRAEIGVGMGYAPHEFRGFGMPVARRLSLMEEGLEVLKLCFAGERFSYDGKRYQFDDVIITPGYVQEGGPPLWIGAMSAAGAHRAARFDSNLLPQGSRDHSLDPWLDDLKSSGRDPADYRIGIIKAVLVTDDREAEWPRVRESERYRMQLYNRFFAESKQSVAPGGQPISQRWVVGNVDECVAELTAFITEFGITDLVTWGAPPGLTPETMNRSLERFATEVVPRLKADLRA
ncbi:MAG: LLM class flavin-dependent oxidoreductase [Pseudomonadales bacterium]|nr:LLM class flavin-dependent oxidoreductase [Pseudomonadales bacterium]MDP7360497.1 LLM class flavin-dependent oxidoreductase [Pseudomonadales bacterium]MDP7594416.1 LLM class flavin-dependent oxidoreductase [Pseudomonadales bacterium]HJN50980.1 LLM class flavin-dependent oxidoreductase [Pseudomonadales bacterium]